jgi:hypothetical protein
LFMETGETRKIITNAWINKPNEWYIAGTDVDVI